MRGLFALATLFLLPAYAQVRSYTFFTFDAPGATSTTVRGMNDAGEMVGSFHDVSGDHAFLRRSDGSFISIDAPGALPGTTAATAINNLGQIVGIFTDASGVHSFLRAADGTFTTLDPTYFPAAINDLGDIAGSLQSFALPALGFVRTADGKVTTFQVPGASQTRPAGINNSGEIVGTYITGGSYSVGHGFLRHADGSFATFDVPGLEPAHMGTWPAAINDHGQIAGYLLSYAYGFVRDPDGTFTVVNALGQTYPYAIDNNGRLAGYIYDNTGAHGFLATPANAAGPLPAIRSLLGVESAVGFGGAQAIAPGGWIEIYGSNLSKTTRSWQASDFSRDLAPTTLDGVSVTVNGQPAPVSYISPGQVNAQVPSTILPGTALVAVTSAGQRSRPHQVTVNAIAPGVAAFPPLTYSSYPLAITLPADPVKAGDTVTLFGIAFGAVTPDLPSGRIARQAGTLAAPVEVLFDYVPAKVTYAGLSPGSVGLYQFNVVVPDAAASNGDFVRYVGVIIRVNGISAQTVQVRVH